MIRSLLRPIHLLNLPVELICYILDNLEIPDLVQCTLVTKYLRKVVGDSSRLQFSIELAKHRLVSLLPASASPPFSTRLQLLRERERAWRFMEWKQRHTLKLPPTGSVYEFVGGLYGNGREDDSRVTASISFLELPSSDTPMDPPNLKTWTHAMGDVNIIDFTMDPSQDLLVLVALAPPESKFVYELHIRSITTNLPHPKSPLSVLPCLVKPSAPPPPSEVIAAVRVQVAGDLVALLIKEVLDSAGAHLEIWNWEHSPQFSCKMSRLSGIDDFTFLTHNAFLLVRPTGRFEVYNFEDPLFCSTTPIMRNTFAFPQLSDGYMYWYISMSSNPAPGYIPRASSSDNLTGKQLYYPRPEERVHACCLYIFNPAAEENHHVHSFVFFLNIATLLNPPEEWFQIQPPPTYMGSEPRFTIGPRFPAQPQGSPSPTTDSESSASSSSAASSNGLSSIDIPIYGLPSSSTPSSSTSSLIPIIGPSPSSSSIQQIFTTPIYPPFPSFSSTIDLSQVNGATHYPFPNPGVTLAPLTAPVPAPAPRRQGPFRHSATSRNMNVTIPWEVWGPQNTRWFEECLSTDWQHAIYGLRTVESVSVAKWPNLHGGKGPSPAGDGAEVGSEQPTLNGHAAQTNGHAPSPSSSSSLSDEGPIAAHPDLDLEAEDGEPARPEQRRFLRIRDFNPYSLSQAAQLDAQEGSTTDKGKHRARWRQPRLVTEPSTTPVKGVFTKDIISSLPYVEVVSEQTFEVTDVMMDDCRMLLLKRGQAGKLKRVDVLMM